LFELELPKDLQLVGLDNQNLPKALPEPHRPTINLSHQG